MSEVTREQVLDFISSMKVRDLIKLVRDLIQPKFDVILTGASSKYKAGGAVLSITSCSMEEAKEIVSNLPHKIVSNVSVDVVESVEVILNDAGCTYLIKPC